MPRAHHWMRLVESFSSIYYTQICRRTLGLAAIFCVCQHRKSNPAVVQYLFQICMIFDLSRLKNNVQYLFKWLGQMSRGHLGWKSFRVFRNFKFFAQITKGRRMPSVTLPRASWAASLATAHWLACLQAFWAMMPWMIRLWALQATVLWMLRLWSSHATPAPQLVFFGPCKQRRRDFWQLVLWAPAQIQGSKRNYTLKQRSVAPLKVFEKPKITQKMP